MEDSLLEYTDAILNLLNMATHKGNLSSSHLVQRLEYLKHRLDDFLCLKMSSATSSKPDSVRQDTGVLYECGICNSPITMYNGDHNLSMDLHCQEEVHQRALSKPDDRRGAKVKDTPVSKVKDTPVPKVDDKYVSLTKAVGMYHCSLCNVNISKNEKQLKQHLKGISHKKNLKTTKDAWSKIPAEWKSHKKHFVKNDDGALHCKPCAMPVNNVSNELLDHLRSKNHTSACVPRPIQAKDFWSTLPKDVQTQKKLFQTSQSGMLDCKVCLVSIVHSSKTLLDHVRGNKHTKQINAFLTANGVKNDTRCTLCGVVTTSKCNMIDHVLSRGHDEKVQEKLDVWSLIPEDHRQYFVIHDNSAMRCVLCRISVALNKVRVLEHIRDKKHNDIHILRSVLAAYCTYGSI